MTGDPMFFSIPGRTSALQFIFFLPLLSTPRENQNSLEARRSSEKHGTQKNMNCEESIHSTKY